MLYADRVDFQDRPSLIVGQDFNGAHITKIEVYHQEYEDHSEMIVIPYASNDPLGKFWNYPCAISYKRSMQDKGENT